MSVPRCLRILLILSLLSACLTFWHVPARAVHAAAPSISVSPTTVVPHGGIQVTGSGFEPSTNGRQVTVDVAITNSGGTFPVGSVVTDAQGNIGATGAPLLTLPFNIDATGTNQVTATEEGNSGISASTLVSGAALQPQLNGGQSLTAHLGDEFDVKGTGFAPNDVVTVSLGGQALSSGAGGNTTTADQSGNVDILLQVPQSAQSGTQTLVVTGSAVGNGQKDQASLSLTLVPLSGNLIVTPNPAAVGTTLRARSGGFQANEPVTFTLRYYDLGQNSYALQNSPATADANGNATALVSIPASADGSKPASVSVSGNISGVSYTVALTFAVLARITFNPPTGLPGAQIIVNGSGFVAGENLFVSTRLFKPPVGRFVTVDATGNFSTTVTLLTTLQSGTNVVLAVSGSGGDQASASFTVAQPVPPAIKVNPTTAPAGNTVTVTGQGFGANENVAFSIKSTPLIVLGAGALTDAVGAFTATVTLSPSLVPGVASLQAKGARSGITKSTSLTITLAQSNHWYFAEGFTGQGPKVFFHETLTLLNYNDQPTSGTITYQFPDGSTESLPVSLKGRALFVEDVNNDLGPNRMVSALVQTDRPIVAQRTILRTDAAKHSLDTDFSPGQSTPQATWYFAEGYSGISFQPYLTVQNPFAVPVTMTVTLYPTSGRPKAIPATVPPFSRYTLNLRGALPGKSFSTSVVASSPVVAERVEYWGAGAGSAKFGAGVKPGVATPVPTWYFGYASILGGDQAFISVLNPNKKPAHVAIRFLDGTGKAAGNAKVTVQPGQRATLTLNSMLGKHPHSPIAAVLSSDLNIVAEEAQYFGGSPNIGTHAGASIEGRSSAATRWTFASGNTASYQENEYILNPGTSSATVVATFLGSDGQVVNVSYLVKPNSVISVSANAVPKLHRGSHGSVWTTAKNVPVVVVQTLRGKDGRSALADQGIPG